MHGRSTAGSAASGSNSDTSLARELYLILFPNGFEEQIEGILDEIGVPGYSEGPSLVGRGLHGLHVLTWPCQRLL